MRKTLIAMFIGAGMIASVPTALRADDNPKVHRYCDRERKDYHEWNDSESSAYRHWITDEQHKPYHEFGKASRSEQASYWRWRHNNPTWH